MGVRLRLRQVSPSNTHADFMTFAASLGLYVLVPLTGTKWGFLPAALPSPRCYTDTIDG